MSRMPSPTSRPPSIFPGQPFAAHTESSLAKTTERKPNPLVGPSPLLAGLQSSAQGGGAKPKKTRTPKKQTDKKKKAPKKK